MEVEVVVRVCRTPTVSREPALAPASTRGSGRILGG